MSAGSAPQAVAVIGAGTMGGGIAAAFAWAGSDVRLMARRTTSLDAARERIATSIDMLAEMDPLPADTARQEALERITRTTVVANAVAGADLVLETIPEDLQRKRNVLKEAEMAMPDGSILVTDTSSLRIAALAEPLSRPDAFAGFHWFNPPELVQLVEIIAGPRTASSTTQQLLEWATAIGKRPVLVQRDVEGFVANRLQYALLREAYALVEGGVCDYAAVDETLKAGLGPRWAAIGPFESVDLAGLDVHHEVARRLFPKLASTINAPKIVKELVEDGALGCKSGVGLYGAYDGESISRLIRRRARVLLALADLERV